MSLSLRCEGTRRHFKPCWNHHLNHDEASRARSLATLARGRSACRSRVRCVLIVVSVHCWCRWPPLNRVASGATEGSVEQQQAAGSSGSASAGALCCIHPTSEQRCSTLSEAAQTKPLLMDRRSLSLLLLLHTIHLRRCFHVKHLILNKPCNAFPLVFRGPTVLTFAFPNPSSPPADEISLRLG